MKMTATRVPEQIVCTASIPDPGDSSTSAVINSGARSAAAAIAPSNDTATVNEVKLQSRRMSSMAMAISSSSSVIAVKPWCERDGG
jgi:hypothetical protein